MNRERKASGSQPRENAARHQHRKFAPRGITKISINGFGNLTINVHNDAIVTVYQNWPEKAAKKAHERGSDGSSNQ